MRYWYGPALACCLVVACSRESEPVSVSDGNAKQQTSGVPEKRFTFQELYGLLGKRGQSNIARVKSLLGPPDNLNPSDGPRNPFGQFLASAYVFEYKNKVINPITEKPATVYLFFTGNSDEETTVFGIAEQGGSLMELPPNRGP